jgi:hypothetical protein
MAVMQLERGRAGDPLTIRAIATAFEAAGIEFIGDDAPGREAKVFSSPGSKIASS